MKLDISELVLIATRACREINSLAANAGNINTEAIKVQNELLKDTYKAIEGWIKSQ
jgi:hypothetical protein